MSMIGNYRRISSAQLAELQANPSSIGGFLYDRDAPDGHHLDIDKSWHAIHFLLHGQVWEGDGPLYDAVLGGAPLGDDDVGYGPARFLTPDEVKSTANALRGVSTSELIGRFDAEEVNRHEIYPGWSGDADDREYLSENFAKIVSFFKLTAERGDALLLYIN